MAPTRRVNTSVPTVLPRLALLVLAAVPGGWLALRLARREARDGRLPRPVHIVTAVVVAFAWGVLRGPPAWPLMIATLVLAWALVCLATIDLAVYRLPDALTLTLMAAGIVVSNLLPDRPFLGHLLGAAVGWGVLAALAWGYRQWRGLDGIGLGDAKLLGAAGAWLGWAALPSVLLVACAGAFLWIGLRALRRGRAAAGERIAFGAPLCLAILIVWLEGPLVI